MTVRLGIFGCGRMAEAMLARWLEVGALAATDVHVVVRRGERAAALAERFGVRADSETAAMLATADLVLLAIKPQQLEDALAPVRAAMRPDALWISVLAGTPIARLRAALGPAVGLVRTMPNTPSRLGLGATATCDDALARALPQRAAADALLTALGAVFPVDEATFDAFTAVAGSGPAYLFAFAEAMEGAAANLGFDDDDARRLVAATLRGASELLSRDGRSAAELRAEVVSPGGTTAAALAVFAARGQDEMVRDALRAAADRSAELARGTR